MVVDGLEDAGALEARVAVARCDGAPADGGLPVVGEDAGDGAGFDDLFHGAAVGLAFAVFEFLLGLAPPHAPAASGGAAGSEEGFEVAPAIWREEVAVELEGFGFVFHVCRIAQGRRGE